MHLLHSGQAGTESVILTGQWPVTSETKVTILAAKVMPMGNIFILSLHGLVDMIEYRMIEYMI